MLEIQTGEDNRVLLSGRLDAAQAPKLREYLDGLSEPCVLDFGGLEYISSAGLGVLLKTQKRFETHGALRVINVSKHIGEIFSYSGLDQIFDVELVE